jgi:hypothetical protein
VGKYYQIVSAYPSFSTRKAVYGSGGKLYWGTKQDDNLNFYWMIVPKTTTVTTTTDDSATDATESADGSGTDATSETSATTSTPTETTVTTYTLQSLATDTYVVMSSSTNGGTGAANTLAATGTDITITPIGETQQVNLTFAVGTTTLGMHPLYWNGGSGGNVISWNGGLNAENSQSAWYIVEVSADDIARQLGWKYEVGANDETLQHLCDGDAENDADAADGDVGSTATSYQAQVTAYLRLLSAVPTYRSDIPDGGFESLFGEGYNHYSVSSTTTKEDVLKVMNAYPATLDSIMTLSVADAKADGAADKSARVTADRVALADLANGTSITLNLPTQNCFLRVRSVAAPTYYLTGNNVSSTTLRALFQVGSDNIQTVHYYDVTTQRQTSFGTGYPFFAASGYGCYYGAQSTYYAKVTYCAGFSNTNCLRFGQYFMHYSDSYYILNATGATSDRGSTKNFTTATFPTGSDGWYFTLEAVDTLGVTTNAVGYATLSAPVALTIPAGVRAYTGHVTDDSYLQLTALEGTIPANTPVVINGTADTTYGFPIAATSEAATVAADDAPSDALSNDLRGATLSLLTTDVTDGTVYTLQRPEDTDPIGFYPYTGTELRGFHAYLVLPTTSEGIRGLIFEGTTTGVAPLPAAAATAAPYYDLSGRRIATPSRGLYISNGRKVFIR